MSGTGANFSMLPSLSFVLESMLYLKCGELKFSQK